MFICRRGKPEDSQVEDIGRGGKLVDSRQDSLKSQDGVGSRIVFWGLPLDRRWGKIPIPLNLKAEIMMDLKVSTFAHGS